jgi:hypothetical protein
MELWRREDLFVDDEPFEGGTYERIHDRIRQLEITYLDDSATKAEEQDRWDMAEKKRLPGAVRIDLELQASPELDRRLRRAAARRAAASTTYDARESRFAADETIGAVDPPLPADASITGRNATAAGGGKGGRARESGKGGGRPRRHRRDGRRTGGQGGRDAAEGAADRERLHGQRPATCAAGRGSTFGRLPGPTIERHHRRRRTSPSRTSRRSRTSSNDYRNRYN